MVIAFKLENANPVCVDQLSGNPRWIITVLQDEDFWRMPECIRQCYEIRTCGHDDETALFSVIADLTIGSAAAQTDVSDVRRARKKIPDKLHQLAGEILIK